MKRIFSSRKDRTEAALQQGQIDQRQQQNRTKKPRVGGQSFLQNIQKMLIDHTSLPVTAIFDPHVHFPRGQGVKRSVYLDQLKNLVERCRYPKATFQSHVHAGSAGPDARIPLDLDPLTFKKNVFFVDYMNLFPGFFQSLLSVNAPKDSKTLMAEIPFRDKLRDLYRPEYQTAFVRYVYKLVQLSSPPSPDDVLMIVCQGEKGCGRVHFMKNEFLNQVQLFVVEVPCVNPATAVECHRQFRKNEVDDYFLLFSVLYFQTFRERVETMLETLNRTYRTEQESNKSKMEEKIRLYQQFLHNQKLYIVSNDNYEWASPIKLRVTRYPRAFPRFTLGVSSTPIRMVSSPPGRKPRKSRIPPPMGMSGPSLPPPSPPVIPFPPSSFYRFPSSSTSLPPGFSGWGTFSSH